MNPFRDIMVWDDDLLLWKPQPMRDYQKEDVAAGRARGRVFLLHKAGMGKTPMGARIVEDARPVVVSAPSHLVGDWADYLEAEYPGQDIRLIAGQSPEVKKEMLAPGADWYVVNHDLLATEPSKRKARVAPRTKPRNYYIMPKGVRSLLVDEFHWLGLGRKARAFDGMKKLADRCDLVIQMSATPVRKTPDGLFAPFRVLDKTFTSYWRFVAEHCKTRETPYKVEIIGARLSLGRLLRKYAIKRTYHEVGLELPSVIPEFSPVKLADETRAKYKTLKTTLRDEYDQPVWSAGAAIPKLRYLTAADPEKLQTLQDFTGDLDSWVIFVWYHETARLLAERLGSDVTVITGQISSSRRTAMARAAAKIIAGIGALAAGVDLSHHRNVFFYEEDYAPGTMENALGRVQRFRKKASDAPVICRYIYATGTLDEKIHRVTKGRGATAEELMAWEFKDE